MRHFFRAIALASVVIVFGGAPALSDETAEDFYRQWVDYRNGEISLTFERLPVQFALHAIHAKTGLQIVIPSSTATKLVDLKLERQPFEPAMRSLFWTIGYRSFALLYDEQGRPNRAVVLNAPPPDLDPATVVLNEERERLRQDLARWKDLKREERSVVEERLKALPASEEREQLVKEYGRRVLGLNP